MEVEKTINLGNGHKIEFGRASWDINTISVRNRYPTSNGGFSPRSSSEIPLKDIQVLTISCIQNDYLSDESIVTIQRSCAQKLVEKKSSNKISWFKNHIEAFGLILLLFSFGWQIFEESAASSIQNTDLYQTHEKLDKIWQVMAADYSKKYSEQLTTHTSVNFEHTVKNWKYWNAMNIEKNTLNNNLQFAWLVRALLYVLGSIFILIPKFRKGLPILN